MVRRTTGLGLTYAVTKKSIHGHYEQKE